MFQPVDLSRLTSNYYVQSTDEFNVLKTMAWILSLVPIDIAPLHFASWCYIHVLTLVKLVDSCIDWS